MKTLAARPTGDGVVAPLGDDEPHGHQHDLEEHEEEQQVERHEGPGHAHLEQQEQADESPHPPGLRADAQQVGHAQRGQPAGEQQQRGRHPIHSQVEAQPQGRHPLDVGGGVGGHGPHGDREGRGGDGQAEAHSQPLAAPGRRDEEQQRTDRREGDDQREQPVGHETRVTTPATRRSTPARSPVR
jgi:hypothetical protein